MTREDDHGRGGSRRGPAPTNALAARLPGPKGADGSPGGRGASRAERGAGPGRAAAGRAARGPGGEGGRVPPRGRALALAGALAAAAALAAALAGPAAAPAHADERAPLASPVVALPGEPSDAGVRWALYMHHVHTVEGRWSGSAEEAARGLSHDRYDRIVRSLAGLGVDAAGVTEHNTFAHEALLAERPPAERPVLMAGIEYSGTTGRGHMGILYDPRREARAILPARPAAVDGADLRAAIAKARRQGALTFVNHPLIGTFPWPEQDLLGAHGVEVDSPATILASLDRNIRWWHERMVAETRPAVAISGADYHLLPVVSASAFRTWLNRVRVEVEGDGPPSAAAIFDGLRRGRVQLVRPALFVGEPARVPVLLLGADADADGRFDDAIEGDLCPLEAGGRARVQVRVLGGDGHRLRLFDEGSARAPFLDEEVAGEDAVFAVERGVRGFGFVRAELRTCAGRRVVITNPLYLGVGQSE